MKCPDLAGRERAADLRYGNGVLSHPHVVFMQHGSDPIVWWAPKLLWRGGKGRQGHVGTADHHAPQGWQGPGPVEAAGPIACGRTSRFGLGAFERHAGPARSEPSHAHGRVRE